MEITHIRKTLVTLDNVEIADILRRHVRGEVYDGGTLDNSDISVRFTNDDGKGLGGASLKGAIVSWEIVTGEPVEGDVAS